MHNGAGTCFRKWGGRRVANTMKSDAAALASKKLNKRKSWTSQFARNYQLHLFMLIPIAYIIIFNYVPMFGIQIAFKNFTPGKGCLLYTSDAADDLLCVDLGGRRLIKKNTITHTLSLLLTIPYHT